MRIDELHFVRFGPFTDLRLDLSAGDQGLHLIVGPNEAGKSSALRGISALLFGFPARTGDNFLHGNQSLFVGGALQHSNGNALRFFRRKGRTATLLAGDETTALPEESLAPFLRGIDAETFLRRFGIDHPALVEGGRAILEGAGDLGEILFAAGEGLIQLHAAQRELADRATAIFSPRGKNPPLNAAIKKHRELGREVQQHFLSAAHWRQVHDALTTAQSQRSQTHQQIEKLRLREGELERLRSALPLATRRQKLLDDIAALADVPDLPADFPQWRQAADQIRAANADIDDAQTRIDQLDRQMAGLAIRRELLEHADAIERLQKEWGSHEKAAADRVKLLSERERLRGTVAALVGQLGREREETPIGPLTETQTQTLFDLATSGPLFVQALADAEAGLQAEHDQRQLLVDEYSKLEEPGDTAKLTAALRLAQPHGDIEQQRRELDAEIENRREELRLGLSQLVGFQGTEEQLAELPLPVEETIDRFEREFNELDQHQRQGEDRVAQLERTDGELARRLDELAREGELPSEAELSRLRGGRDQGWSLVRKAWLEGDFDAAAAANYCAPELEREPAPVDLAESFERSLAAADEHADRLRREADRVAQRAQRLAERDELASRRDAERAQLDRFAYQRQQLTEQWRLCWPEPFVAVLSPREMRSLLTKVQRLRERQTELRCREQQRRQLHERVEQVGGALIEGLRSVGRSVEPGRSLTSLVDEARGYLEEGKRAAGRREQLQVQIRNAAAALRDGERRLEKARRELADWQRRWGEAVTPLGMSPQSPVNQVHAVVETLARLDAQRRQLDSIAQRIAGIDADAATFTRRVGELLRQVAADLDGSDPALAAGRLGEQLKQARAAVLRHDAWREQSDEQAERKQRATRVRAEASARVRAFCEAAAVENSADLPAIEARFNERHQLKEELRKVEETLAPCASGAPLEAFLAQLDGLRNEQLRIELDELRVELSELERRRAECDTAIGQWSSELSRMNGADLAARTQQQASDALAEIAGHVEEFARLRLASLVLAEAIDRYRNRHQQPVLESASRRFAALTLGSFKGLRVDVEGSRAILVGVRDDDREVTVDGMSTGTRDQLFLALRLASLEVRLENDEPFPFIVDDIAVHFDEVRAVAMLRQLAELSTKTQILFFTHQRHLAELAREALDERALTIHELAPWPADITLS